MNFSPGPAVLPLEVLERAREDFTDWRGSGMSVMEISHRSKAFLQVAKEAEQDFRDLLSVPANYQILFLQGGASAQFSVVPMNLARPDSTVDYVHTGHWSHKAMTEAARYSRVHLAGDAGGNYSRVPPQAQLRLSADAAYCHYTPNETISGVEFGYVPDTARVPLVADMSSSILSQPLDVSRFGLIYAGAQKNIGPAGLTLAVVRDDLMGAARPETPRVFDYKLVAENQSMLNTPPTFAWYMAGLVFKWLKTLGGMSVVGERNRIKAQTLYAAIDASGLYHNDIALDSRSRMNVTFTLFDQRLESAFLDEASAAGLQGLKGHRAQGGLRASIYNALPLESVQALIAFMKEFERRHG